MVMEASSYERCGFVSAHSIERRKKREEEGAGGGRECRVV
jgi:hypothetical protein